MKKGLPPHPLSKTSDENEEKIAYANSFGRTKSESRLRIVLLMAPSGKEPFLHLFLLKPNAFVLHGFGMVSSYKKGGCRMKTALCFAIKMKIPGFICYFGDIQ